MSENLNSDVSLKSITCSLKFPAMDEKAQVQLPLDLAGTVVRPAPPITSHCICKSSPSVTTSNSPSSRGFSSIPISSDVLSRSLPSVPGTQSCRRPRKLACFRRVPQFVPGRRLMPWLVVVAFWFFLGFRVQSDWFFMERYGHTHIHILGHFPEINRLDLKRRIDENSSPRQSGLQGELSRRVSLGTEDGNKAKPTVSGSMKSLTRKLDREFVQPAEEQISLQSPWRMGNKEAHTIVPGLGVLEAEWPHFPKPPGMIGGVKTIGKLVGPFDDLEAAVIGREKFGGKCEIPSLFATSVAHKVVVVVFHELSMTGAPLSMLELATKMRICEASVSAVILNKAGGLHSVLVESGVQILEDKSVLSWSAAKKADLVIVGSAACAPWVISVSFQRGADRLVWWVMENRREYFDRAKDVLGDVRALMFLSRTQAQLWTEWYSQNGSDFTPAVYIVPLSINDELVSVAGLNNVSNDLTKKCGELRRRVREAMGLDPNDLLLMTLGSINSGKGQLLLVQAALMVAKYSEDQRFVGLALVNPEDKSRGSKERFIQKEKAVDVDFNHEGSPRVGLLIGSVGSKSNKPAYVEKILSVLDQNPRLASLIMSVAATTHVFPLYAAADAYVMNSQGIGETFGRVTIEAMAFGLPVLATNAGGSLEIVDENFTGLLHPIGIAGTPVLAEHILWLAEHKEERQHMGRNGREKVIRLFREELMYEKLAKVFMPIVDSLTDKL